MARSGGRHRRSNDRVEIERALALILGPVEELLSGASGRITKAQRSRLETVQRNAGQLPKLVKALLDSSRAEPSHPRSLGVDRALSVALEVTEQARIRRERERYIDELKRTVHMSEMFMAVLGHDLRGPLCAISAGVGLLRSRSKDPVTTDLLARVGTSTERMTRMIGQLLDFTVVRLGWLPVSPRAVDLGELCGAIVCELETAFSAGLRCEGVGDLNGTWDRDRLAQVVSNLGGNACQHRTPGTPIVFRLDGSAAERVVLDVHNAGVIPPSLLRVLFEPFCDGGGGRPGSSGLGLGLHITREIVLAHGGAIDVVSTEESGTRFTVTLPRHAAPVAPTAFGR